jgi:hypothetical protein
MVRECISEKIITRDRVQKFSRRARCYVLGYHILWQMQQGIIHEPSDSKELKAINDNLAIIPVKLEQMVKKIKMHRCTMDFDHAFAFCKTIFKQKELTL